MDVKQRIQMVRLIEQMEMLAQLIYARVLYPCSKSKTVSMIFPHLYNGAAISEDQVYDGCAFIGGAYKKYIELFNHCYEQQVSGKTVQVADKGLNCARTIYAAVREANDGYIFSKSVHGSNLSGEEKKWLLLENDTNVFTDYTDKDGHILFRLKSCIDTFDYHFKEIDPETGRKIHHL